MRDGVQRKVGFSRAYTLIDRIKPTDYSEEAIIYQ